MQASLENLFKQLISENFLVFVDVNNFLQNTYSEDCFESRENFMRLYRRDGDVESKRGYVWIKDCPNLNTAFQAIYKHDCFVYKIRMTSFDETKQEEHLNKVCETATARGFTRSLFPSKRALRIPRTVYSVRTESEKRKRSQATLQTFSPEHTERILATARVFSVQKESEKRKGSEATLQTFSLFRA